MGQRKKDDDPHQILLGHTTQNQKFKAEHQIISRILWDKSYDQSDFSVGYEDRFLGILEMPFTEFIKSEVPHHRTKYFKKKGIIMWDRAKRINNF